MCTGFDFFLMIYEYLMIISNPVKPKFDQDFDMF